MGKTIAEKIFSKKSGTDAYAGDIVIADVDLCMTHSGNRPLAQEVLAERGEITLFDPKKIVMVNDHEPQSSSVKLATVQTQVREFAREHGTLYHELGEGIEHIILPETGEVGPGDLMVGSDSHSQTYGAINCCAVGVGSTEIANAMTCGKLWFKVPETIRYELVGKLPKGVYAKDIALYIAGRFGGAGALYKAVEYTGPVIHEMSMDARFTLSNMTTDMGAKTNFMEIDDVAETWLKEHHKAPYEAVTSDPDANVEVITIDVSELSPQIAKPHKVDNVAPVNEVLGTPVNIAVVGTCTNGRLEDLKIAAELIKGKKIHPNVRLYIIPGSQDIMLKALEAGYISALVEAGAIIGSVGCGGCGSSFACPADGQVVISAGPRNFKGRKGNKNGFVYLGSPATVVTSAIAGEIVDCRDYL